MGLVVGLPRISSGKNSMWMIIDQLKKSVKFLLVTNIDTLGKLTQLYVKEIVQLPKILKVIFFDRDPKFISHFWKSPSSF